MIPIIISAIENPADCDLMTEFYLANNALMFHEARKYIDISEDAEDIVYEALAKIIDKMDVFRDLKSWQQRQYAVTTVRNLAYIFLKRKNHFEFVSLDGIDFDILSYADIDTEAEAEKRIILSAIRQIWNSLEVEDKVLLEQKYVLKWKDQEIAEPLNIQSQSVRMRLTRAKRKLVLELQKKGISFAEWL